MIDLKGDRNGRDRAVYVSLKGLGDLGEGESVKLHLGESAVVGRSRHCDWSLKRTPGYLTVEDGRRAAIRRTLLWRSTSRRHCRVTYIAPDVVDVENLSQNGTLVDGRPIDRILLTDCRRVSHRIRLGPYGVTLALEPGALPVDVVDEENGAS